MKEKAEGTKKTWFVWPNKVDFGSDMGEKNVVATTREND
jgi:hypothetical protein